MSDDTYVDDTCLCDLPLPDEQTNDVTAYSDVSMWQYICPCGRKWVAATGLRPIAVGRLEYGETWEGLRIASLEHEEGVTPGQWYSPYAGASYEHTQRDQRRYPAKEAEHLSLQDVMEVSYTYMRWFRGHDPDDVGRADAKVLERLEVERANMRERLSDE